MNNIIGRNSKEVRFQLKRAETQKNILIKNIYKEYEAYFKIVRKSIFSSTKKGIVGIYSDFSIRDRTLHSMELNNFLNKNISFLIHSKLPFITIEQLKVGHINVQKKQIVNENAYKEFVKFKELQWVDYDVELITAEPFEFDCNNNSNRYEYYEDLSEDQFLTMNLDKRDFLNSTSEHISIKEIEDEKNIGNSVLELIDETNECKLNDYESIYDQVNDVIFSSDNLNFFELIDKAFSNFLLDLSYKINSELFKINLIDKIIPEETYKCLLNNNYIIKHPHPFVIKYDLVSNKLSEKNNKTSNVYLFNINNIELEFYDLNLSICRNNINELKDKFRILNKKLRYWKQKELFLN